MTSAVIIDNFLSIKKMGYNSSEVIKYTPVYRVYSVIGIFEVKRQCPHIGIHVREFLQGKISLGAGNYNNQIMNINFMNN